MKFVLYALCFVFSSFAQQSPDFTIHTTFSVDNTRLAYHKSCGVRVSCSDYSNYNSSDCSESLAIDGQEEAAEYDILNNYEWYALEDFRAYARTLPCYEEFICLLHDKIKNDKSFRKKTAHIRGFNYSFSWGTEKSGFHDFIRDEARKIINTKNKKIVPKQGGGLLVDIDNVESLVKYCNTTTQNLYENNRLAERIKAIGVTRNQYGKRFDYSSQVHRFNAEDHYAKEFNNTCGTQLDCQLYKELYQSRSAMMQLERMYSHNHHIQVIAPIIHYYAAQAKIEKNPLAAFKLSDFCHSITQFLVNGMHILYDGSCAVGKGAWKGTKEFVNPEHWREMATGALHLGLLCADAVGQEEVLGYAVHLVMFSKDSDAVMKVAQNHCLHTQVQKDAINKCIQQTFQKIRKMSWQELMENGTEIGTTMILDTLALHALSGFTRAASGSLVKNLNSAMESGVLLTEEYAVEVAGFGKLIIEEGAEIATKAADIIKNNSGLLRQEGKSVSQIIHKMEEGGGVLLPFGVDAWKSPGGIIYGYDRKFGNALNHILSHMTSNPTKINHTVFSISKDQIVALIDEAWAMRGNHLVVDPRAHIIDMKRVIGTKGETAIRIIVRESGASEIITAYPVII